jgi:hypothetical protein
MEERVKKEFVKEQICKSVSEQQQVSRALV